MRVPWGPLWPFNKPRKIETHVNTLSVLALVPILLLFAVVILLLDDDQRQIEERVAHMANIVSDSIDDELRQKTEVLIAMSHAPAIAEQRDAVIHAWGRKVVEELGAHSMVLSRNRAQALNTLVEYGAGPLPSRHVPRMQALTDELEAGTKRQGYVFVEGPLAKRWLVVAATRIPNKEPVETLAITLDPSVLSRIMMNARLPKGHIALLVDPSYENGKVIARSERNDEVVGKDLDDGFAEAVNASKSYSGVWRGLSISKIPVYTVWVRSPTTGWILRLGVTEEDLTVSKQYSTYLFFLMLGVTLFVGVFGIGIISNLKTALETLPHVEDGEKTSVVEVNEARTRINLLLREVDHRSKNLLNNIISMLRISSRASEKDVSGFATDFEKRLIMLDELSNLMSDEKWEVRDLRSVIEEALRAHSHHGLMLQGEDVLISRHQVKNLFPTFYELATNAAKYGALSRDEGTLSISWFRVNGNLGINWVEGDGPEVTEPTHTGFGTVQIRAAIESQLNGTIELNYDRFGFSCAIRIPYTSPTV